MGRSDGREGGKETLGDERVGKDGKVEREAGDVGSDGSDRGRDGEGGEGEEGIGKGFVYKLLLTRIRFLPLGFLGVSREGSDLTEV